MILSFYFLWKTISITWFSSDYSNFTTAYSLNVNTNSTKNELEINLKISYISYVFNTELTKSKSNYFI